MANYSSRTWPVDNEVQVGTGLHNKAMKPVNFGASQLIPSVIRTRDSCGYRPMSTHHLVGAISLVALTIVPARAERVCVTEPWGDHFSRSKYVALARVVSRADDQRPFSFSLVAVRSWRGNAKTFTARTRGATEGGWLWMGDHVLIYAPETDFGFDECSQPWPTYDARVQREIAALDRFRKYPPLHLPAEALRRPKR
jgi:hypothetical protein